MRIAVPLFEENIAPRFCAADRLLVVDTAGEPGGAREVGRDVVALAPGGFPQRIAQLRELGVDRLLCGGFNRRFLPVLEGIGVRISWGLAGNADEVLADVLAGRDPVPLVTMRAATLGSEGARRPGCAFRHPPRATTTSSDEPHS